MKSALFIFTTCLLVIIGFLPYARTGAQLAMPSGSNAGIEGQVNMEFADVPAMIGVAECESGFRQYDSSGFPLRGGTDGNYIGVFQISSGWAATAAAMNMDIYSTAGNLAFAQYLYEQKGLQPWSGCVSGQTANQLPTTGSDSEQTPTSSSSTPSATGVMSNTTTASSSLIVAPVATPTLTASSSSTIAVASTINADSLTATLSMGMISPQVLLLQQLLNAEGFTLATSGPGSPGNETTKFGSLTRAAVQKFQCAKNIVCSGNEVTTGYGLVGPHTRAALLAGNHE